MFKEVNMTKLFCDKCGRKIKGRNKYHLCEDCRVIEYNTMRKLYNQEEEKFEDVPEEEEETLEEPIEETSEE